MMRICSSKKQPYLQFVLLLWLLAWERNLAMCRNFFATNEVCCDAVSCFFGRRWWRRRLGSSFQSRSLLSATANESHERRRHAPWQKLVLNLRSRLVSTNPGLRSLLQLPTKAGSGIYR